MSDLHVDIFLSTPSLIKSEHNYGLMSYVRGERDSDFIYESNCWKIIMGLIDDW